MGYTEGAEMDINITADININFNGGGVVDPPEEPPQEPSPDEQVINSNIAYFATPSEQRLPLPAGSADRFQVVGIGWTATARYASNNTIQLPPFIFHSLTSATRGKLLMEVAEIAGEFGLKSTQPVEQGKYYAVRQRGFMNAKAKAGQSVAGQVALGLQVHVNGNVMRAYEQDFPSLLGSYEIFWYMKAEDDLTIDIEPYLQLRYAVLGPESKHEIFSIEVVELDFKTPDDATFYVSAALG